MRHGGAKLEGQPRRNEERYAEEKKSDLEKAARKYKAKTGVGCDGFHPKLPLVWRERNKRRGGGVLGEGGTVSEMAATSLHNDLLLNSENVTSERPIAFMLTMIRGGKPCEHQRLPIQISF